MSRHTMVTLRGFFQLRRRLTTTLGLFFSSAGQGFTATDREIGEQYDFNTS